MSVLKAFRNVSEMEFFKNGMRLREALTRWLLKDFGNNRKYKPLQQAIKGISEEDKETVNAVAEKYDYTGDKTFKKLYPGWFADTERVYLIELMRDMMGCIVSANTIYVTTLAEYDKRRDYQNQAIADCFRLYQELQYIITIFPNDLNELTDILDKTEKEIELLKGWRKSDNKTKKRLEQ